jgi:phosphate-selective porin OprO and OprP
MNAKILFTAALCATTMMSAPVFAQDAEPAASAQEVAAMRAEMKAMRAEIAEMKAAQAKAAATPAPASPPAAVPSWKGAPQYDDKDKGFSFKPKGTIQVDAGYVDIPGNAGGTVGPVSGAFGAAGVNSNTLGFNSRLRRAIIGAEGSLPGGFGYNVEFELSQSGVNYEDVILTYQRKGSPLQIKLGYHYPLSSLELMTSSKNTSFMERAGNTDAFGYTRRLGLSATYAKGAVSVAGGLFSEDIANANFNRTGWQASGRAIWAPKFGDAQLHFALNAQHRVAPRDAQNVRYRQRPYTQNTDQRFLDTGRIAADGDDILGVEIAGVQKSFHFAAEAQKLWVRGFNTPLTTFGPNNGTGGAAAFLTGDPSFFSGYGEIGVFLTGETRGYKGGRWERTKVLHPFDKGGWGAFQINARVDYTDLQDSVGGGAVVPGSLNYTNGGKQTGYGVSVHWLPMDYIKFVAQFTHVDVTGGPAAQAPFSTSTSAFNFKDYASNVFALRAQVDF